MAMIVAIEPETAIGFEDGLDFAERKDFGTARPTNVRQDDSFLRSGVSGLRCSISSVLSRKLLLFYF